MQLHAKWRLQLIARQVNADAFFDKAFGVCVVLFCHGDSKRLAVDKMRQMLVISLCWGVCFLAFRDTFRTKQMNFGVPESMYRTEDLKETIVMTAYMTVAGLAALAALGETFSQGSVWTKRCYFGAAALYFTGIGLNSLSGTITWQAIVLSVTGLTAILGCIFTTDIISNEDESDVTGPSDDEQQRENEERHQSALKDKEWHDKIAIT